MDSLAKNHPKQKLLFFVAQDLDESIRASVRDFVLRLGTLRQWLNGAPIFVGTREEPQDGVRGDAPVETVGGYIELYSAIRPWQLPREIDLHHLDEVKLMVNKICEFSREHNLAFEFELDGVFVGAIEDGEVDRTLAQGFLGEWEQQLAVSG